MRGSWGQNFRRKDGRQVALTGYSRSSASLYLLQDFKALYKYCIIIIIIIQSTGTVDTGQGSDRPRSARMDENIDQVNDMVLSQEDQPRTHSTVREISRKTDIPKLSVVRIIWKDLQLKCFKRRPAQELTEANSHCSKSYFWRSFSSCRGLPLLYRWKDVHCGCSSERIVKIS